MPSLSPVPSSDPAFMSQQRRLAIGAFVLAAAALTVAALLGKVIDPINAHARMGAVAVFFGSLALIAAGAVMTFLGPAAARWGNPLIALGVGGTAAGLIGLALVARPQGDL